MPSARVLDARGVTKWFGEVTALDRVDLTVEAGSVHGLVGSNGAGKTTLLSIVLGLTHPDEGTLTLFGRPARGAQRLDGVAGTVDAPRFYPYLSGARNLAALSRLDDDTHGDAEGGAGPGPDRIAAALEVVGLGDAGRTKVRGYSLGMRQRLGLACALVRRPRLLVLDEPTNGLDPRGVRDVVATIRALAEAGTAVLLSSHDMSQVERLCDRVTVLARGTVAFHGGLADLRATAPQPTWRLRTSDDAAALAAAGARVEVARSGDGLRVDAAVTDLDAYVARLVGAGVAIRTLVEETSALESLFLRLTGAPAGTDPVDGARDEADHARVAVP